MDSSQGGGGHPESSRLVRVFVVGLVLAAVLVAVAVVLLVWGRG